MLPLYPVRPPSKLGGLFDFLPKFFNNGIREAFWALSERS